MYAARILFRAGYAPAGQLLFLACPSKSNQKEGHPAYRPFGVPCVARHAGRLRHTIFRARMGTESRSPLVGNSHVSLREALLEQMLVDTPRHGCATRRCTGAPKTKSTPAVLFSAVNCHQF